MGDGDFVVVERTALLKWGWYLGFGIAWIVFGMTVLSANPTSIKTISYVVAAVLVLAGLFELVAAFAASGWRWLHLIIGLVFLTMGIAFREPGSLWGLVVFLGILDMAIGLWAIGDPERSTWLLLLWIGIGTIIHGVTEIVGAFELRAREN